jgi:hypothetical protein
VKRPRKPDGRELSLDAAEVPDRHLCVSGGREESAVEIEGQAVQGTRIRRFELSDSIPALDLDEPDAGIRLGQSHDFTPPVEGYGANRIEARGARNATGNHPVARSEKLVLRGRSHDKVAASRIERVKP